ncbi:MAG: NRAMP family divalent metal transporter [Chthoniobacterales bacterium]|jgi:Mn2+/Fe2+ NRAMP family transporter
MEKQRSFWTAFGPGLLFAGAAVGVSHLVQSTRAGASFGLSMLLVVILANVIKFPGFRFGPQYAAATGHSLIDGYRRQGRWTLVLFTLLTAGTMFTVIAVVTLVTAGVGIAVFGLEPLLASTVGEGAGSAAVSALIMILSAVLLAGGGYVWLDRFIKVVMPVLTLCTLAAMFMALGRIDWSWGALVPGPAVFDLAGLAFCVALIGWMPAPIDISVWSSLWAVARAKHQTEKPAPRDVLMDFDIGYWATMLLALAFVLLGTGMMFGQGLTFENNPAKFSAQIVELYTTTLGGWSRPIIGAAAFLVMLSTSVTVIDAFPRVIAALLVQLRLAFAPRTAARSSSIPLEGDRHVYRISFAVLCAGALAILLWGMSSFTALVDLATTLSFLTAPMLAFFNHRAVHAPEVPHDQQPGTGMTAFSWVSILLQAAFALYFLWFKFGPSAV